MRTLYFGLEAPVETGCVHCPLIRIVPLHTPEVANALAQWDDYTHLLVTSKSTVKLLCDEVEPLATSSNLASKASFAIPSKVYSIGHVTTQHLMEKGIKPYKTAQDESSEGVIALLRGEPLEKGHLFWPHSARSRTLIVDYLRQRGIRFTDCPLYDTVAVRPDPLPKLEAFDAVVFTSPSTVEAFFQLFRHLPPHLQIRTIGPVTAEALNRLAPVDIGSTSDEY